MTQLSMIESDARFSDCERYRYLLRRVWDRNKPRVLIVMLNPSTANARTDDPTVLACIRQCRALGYGSFEIVNLFALKSTDPRALKSAPDPVGPQNDDVIEAAVHRCDLVICAWGAHPFAGPRARHVTGMLRRHRAALFCFGITKGNAPRHPLYTASGSPLVIFSGAK
jgi:hypothetical protein